MMKKNLVRSVAFLMSCIMLLCASPMNIFAADTTAANEASLEALNEAVSVIGSITDYLHTGRATYLTKKLMTEEDAENLSNATQVLSDVTTYLSAEEGTEDELTEAEINILREAALILEKISFYLSAADYTSIEGMILRGILPRNSVENIRKAAVALKTISNYFEDNNLTDLEEDIKNEISTETTTSRTKQFISFVTHTVGQIFSMLTNGYDLNEDGIVGYLYDPAEKCFYTSSDPWQRTMGYNALFDGASPLVLIDFDTVRLKFDYADKNWLIQVWKGQYGLVFYGAEIGVYTKPTDRTLEFYDCASDEDRLMMSFDFYEYKSDFLQKPIWEKKFSRPYGEYWWCTGFIPGNRNGKFEDLRVTARITMKDYEMLDAFTGALDEQIIPYETNGLDVIFSYN